MDRLPRFPLSRMDENATVNVGLARVTLEKIKIGLQEAYPRMLLIDPKFSVNDHAEHLSQHVLFRLEGYLWGKQEKIETTTTETKTADISWPSTWWDHLKEQHAPQWFKKRWPVKFTGVKYETEIKNLTTIHETKICPHLNIEARQEHLEFLQPSYR